MTGNALLLSEDILDAIMVSQNAIHARKVLGGSAPD
jgi:hypothetical protein